MAEKMSVEQRIKHFLTLAEDKGATQDERDLASAQAERLMLKHAIDAAMLDGLDTSKPSEKIVVEKIWLGGTYAYEMMHGLGVVAGSLGLKHYYLDYRSFGEHINGNRVKGVYLAVVGFEGDLATALPLLKSLETQAMVAVGQWAKIRLSSWMTASEKYKARREFIEGFGSGAGRRIRDERQTVIDETTGSALVLVDRSKKVAEHFETINLRTRTDRRVDSGTGRGAGYAAGQQANVGGSQKSIG